jgi:tRNA nucleotidyltransferase/poly(A) polymerase
MTYLDRTDTFVAGLGLEAYRVGGSVRDELLGRKVKDADYVVRNASLSDLYARVADAGAKPSALKLRDGRTVGVRANARGLGLLEIVLPRVERSTGPGHRDFEIVVDPSLPLGEDAIRRDFTFNALYRPIVDSDDFEDHDVIDPTGRGVYDLNHRLINVTHADSFRDDPLRILRALRFVSTLDYELGAETRALMLADADATSNLVGPQGGASATAFEELCKLLMGQNPAKALRLARDVGVLERFLPELSPMLGFDQGSRYHDMTTDEHTFVALETAAHVEAPLRVRLALLFHDSGKPESAWIGKDGRKHYYAKTLTRMLPDDGIGGELATWKPVEYTTEDHEAVGARLWREAAARLGVPRRVRDEVNTLIENHMVGCEKVKPVKVRRARVALGDDMLRDLYLMRACDLSGKGTRNMKFLANIHAMERERSFAQERGVPAAIGDLQINGRDCIERGIYGPAIGEALAAILDEVVCQPDELRRSREWQLERAARWTT